MKFSDSNYQKSLSRELNAIVGIDDAFPLPDHVADMVVAAKSVQSSLLRPRRCKKLRPQPPHRTCIRLGKAAAPSTACPKDEVNRFTLREASPASAFTGLA
jgi:hypothetical protein